MLTGHRERERSKSNKPQIYWSKACLESEVKKKDRNQTQKKKFHKRRKEPLLYNNSDHPVLHISK